MCLPSMLRAGFLQQVPPDETAEFQEFLKELGYTYHDESRNPVYEQFFKDRRGTEAL